MAKEARIELSERVESSTRRLGAPKEVADVPFEGIDRELEMSAEPIIPLSHSPTRRLRPRRPYFG